MKNKYKTHILIVLLMVIGSNCQSIKSKLVIIEGNTFNYGNVSIGDTIVHTFSLKNVGNSNLEILKIVPSCSCTVVNLEKKSIKPKEISKMTIRFTFKNEDIGENDKQVIIRTDSDSSLVILNLIGSVKK